MTAQKSPRLPSRATPETANGITRWAAARLRGRAPLQAPNGRERSSWCLFMSVWRNFGPGVALRVTTSKVRGALVPASAMPVAPTYDGPPRELSVLVDAARCDAAALQGAVEALARRGRSNWEVCVCQRPPLLPDMERALSSLRGGYSWVRIVSADGTVDKATVAQWTVQQSTGEFVALLAPGRTFDADAAAKLLALLRDDPRLESAVLLETDAGTDDGPNLPQGGDCRLVVQRKSRYLAAAQANWPLTAPALAKALCEARTALVETRRQSRPGDP